MSIALSAVIQPSRVLLTMVGLQCLLAGLTGSLIATGIVGDLQLPGRLALAATCLLAAVCGMTRYYRSIRTVQIDISGTGQIRVTDIAVAQAMQASQPVSFSAQLLQGTTLWPHLLLLRLRLDGGSVRTITILPDSVSKDTLRILSVACRWIAAHTSQPDGADQTGFAGLANE